MPEELTYEACIAMGNLLRPDQTLTIEKRWLVELYLMKKIDISFGPDTFYSLLDTFGSCPTPLILNDGALTLTQIYIGSNRIIIMGRILSITYKVVSITSNIVVEYK